VNASFFGGLTAGGVNTCLGAGFAGFFAGGFTAGGVNGAVVVVGVVGGGVVVVVGWVVAPGGGEVVVPPQFDVHPGVVVVVPPQFDVHVGGGGVVVVVLPQPLVLPLSLPLLPLLPAWFWSQLPTPPPFATQLLEPAGSACWPGGQTLPGPVGVPPPFPFDCPGGLGGLSARATAEATPAAITTTSTAAIPIGRSLESARRKLSPPTSRVFGVLQTTVGRSARFLPRRGATSNPSYG